MRKTAMLTVTVMSFVLAVTGIASASASVPTLASHAGRWKGHTGQGKTIKFHVTRQNKINTISFTIVIQIPSCGEAVGVTDQISVRPPAAISNARFRIHKPGPDPATVTGHFLSATRAAGNLVARVKDPVSGCSGSKRTSWTAHRLR